MKLKNSIWLKKESKKGDLIRNLCEFFLERWTNSHRCIISSQLSPNTDLRIRKYYRVTVKIFKTVYRPAHDHLQHKYTRILVKTQWKHRKNFHNLVSPRPIDPNASTFAPTSNAIESFPFSKFPKTRSNKQHFDNKPLSNHISNGEYITKNYNNHLEHYRFHFPNFQKLYHLVPTNISTKSTSRINLKIIITQYRRKLDLIQREKIFVLSILNKRSLKPHQSGGK